jgi:plastocyanin
MRFPKPRLLVAVAVLALIAAACGGGDTADETTDATPSVTNPRPGTTSTAPAPDTTASAPDTTTPPPPGDGTELTIGAIDNEGFTRDLLQAPVGDITVTFENKDLSTGEPHNWHLITDFGEWSTTIQEAPDTQSVSFTIDTPGEYKFTCDTHLEAMNGTLIVTP